MPGYLPVISGKQAMMAFQRLGWKLIRVGSSRHYIFKKEGMVTTLSIPDHKVLDRGILRSLIRDAYITIDEFCENL